MNYSVAAARQHIARALDEAELGEPVAIVRRGVRFRIVMDPLRKVAQPARALLEVVDPALLDGDWHWEAAEDGQLALQVEPVAHGVVGASGVAGPAPVRRASSKPRPRKSKQ